MKSSPPQPPSPLRNKKKTTHDLCCIHKNFYVLGIIPSVSDISMNNLHDQYFLTLHDVY